MIEALLSTRFPAYAEPDTSATWKRIYLEFQCGQVVRGTIVARFPFGLAIDIGAPLPGLLLVTRVPGLTHEIYSSSSCFEAGASCVVTIERFAVNQNQIGLTVSPSWPPEDLHHLHSGSPAT